MLATSKMRPVIAIVLLVAGPASADRLGGSSSGGGGGRLGAVSAGMSSATGGNASPQPGGADTDRVYDRRDYDDCVIRERGPCELDAIVQPGAPPSMTPTQQPGARFEAYAGAQLVYESTGSLSVELAAVDRRFRFDGALTRYYEDRMETSPLTMTMWSLAAGMRIDDGGASRAILQAGVIGAKTSGEPAGDSSITGALIGARLEHPVTRRLTAFGVAQAMYFNHDVRAYSGRVGARFGVVEAAIRVLDFNVGPALFGPELGVRF